jgi:alkylation response protein AidB-like acyl-CoA dehydrogenase
MPTYLAPIPDILFLLKDVFGYEESVLPLPGNEEATLDVVGAILEGANRLVVDFLLPANLPGDLEGCTWIDGAVSTPAGYKAAYDEYRRGGWPALAGDLLYGGQGLPASLALIVRELIAAGSMAFGMYGGLTQGAARAIAAHGDPALKDRYLPHLVSGRWAGTMCMTEAESGSDLSTLRTRAVPQPDGSYAITGTKIFISAGDHDLTENIVHLVLARLPDAPTGTRGISLFLVPKYLNEQDRLVDNNVHCGSIEHKMGIRGSATAVLHFEASRGWLLGAGNGGMKAMFTMMNSSRIGVAVQSVGVAELAYQNALTYAQERVQGRAPGAPTDSMKAATIIAHPDVRKNLLTMKVLVEGMRALYIQSALLLDVRARHPERVARDDAEAMLALMTPMLKAFISDCALQVTDLGIQIYGGHGYIHENGMEQLYRDARIVPLYEGTNAIQALDLAHRKLDLDDGRPMQRFIEDAMRLIDATRHADDIGSMAPPLQHALQLLQLATKNMRAHVRDDAMEAAAAASDYLRLFGLVALGVAWLRMAKAAASGMRREPDAAAFHTGKIKAARFFFARMLSEIEQRYSAIQSGAGFVMDIGPEEF